MTFFENEVKNDDQFNDNIYWKNENHIVNDKLEEFLNSIE